MITIIDYNAGNLTSVKMALEYIGVDSEITSDRGRILNADRVIFPGVGAAGSAMANLKALGLVEAIKTVVSNGVPFLGICLGTQIIFESSEENQGTTCIGLIPGDVKRFVPTIPVYKIPQIGWNNVRIAWPQPLFEGIDDLSEFYFVHSYYPVVSADSYVMAETAYNGIRFASAIGKANLFAVQFHPERSGRVGLRMLQNFSKWVPLC